VASRIADWNEVCELVGVMQTEGTGVFELAREDTKRDPERRRSYINRMRELAVSSKVPVTFSGNYSRKTPHLWRDLYDLVDDIVAGGGRALIQAHTRWMVTLISFETNLPYDRAPVWRELRSRPLAEQEAALRDPAMRQTLKEAALAETKKHETATGPAPELRPNLDYDWVFPLSSMKNMVPPQPSIGQMAREKGQEPIDVFLDMALAKNLKQFFMLPGLNEDQDVVLSMMRHPHTAVTFSDSGAHVSQIMDSSLQTHMLSYWVRERQAFTLEQAIRKMTWDVASFWGLKGRGMIRQGNMADLVIFDPETITAQMPTVAHDLPGGERRLKQKSDGILATIVGGQVLLRNNEHTGALPGILIRGGRA
jgi:N-acyl-D-aspartate/D-glutamate deacylase